MMQLVIAEKPSVAQSIATVIGAKVRGNGYLEGGGYIVTWCFGHLVELASPEVYDQRYAVWRYEDLPIFPQPWQYVVAPETKKQYEVIRRLLHDSRMDSVICATDAGREGELIFRQVYQLCGCTLPIKRLWISSLEEESIHNGFQSLHDGAEYERLYMAAICRAEADWLVGFNGTRFFSLVYGQTLSVGRVMSPTLALIVTRAAQIAAFKREAFYVVRMSCGFYANSERLATREEAEIIKSSCDYQAATIQRIDRREKVEQPPKLFDLTSLQREANKLFGYTASQTLQYAQGLYEKKLITYPRTDSRFLTADLAPGLPDLVQTVACALPFTAGLNLPIHVDQVIDDKKVSDHHALLPTRQLPDYDLPSLPAGERNLLYLIVVRLLCAVGDAHRFEEITVKLDCQGYTFSATGKTIRQMGWKIPATTFQGGMGNAMSSEAEADREYRLPELKEGQTLSPVLTLIHEGQTTPPQNYTEASLLAAMENAGAEELPEDAERKGLGTPATRAGIIEKLVKDGYIVRTGEGRQKMLIPTDKGTALVTVLPEQLQSPITTAEWEQRLKQIERGEVEPESFIADIKDMLNDLLHTYVPVAGAETLFPCDKQRVGECPNCHMPVTETAKGFFCDNRTCRFGLWKDNRFFTSKGTAPTSEIVAQLLSVGHARLTGLKSARTGKLYDATIHMICAEDGSAQFKMTFDGEQSTTREATQ